MAICPFCKKDVKHLDLVVYIEEGDRPIKTFEITLFIGTEDYEIPEEINEDYVKHFYKCASCKSTLFDNKEDTEDFIRHGEVTERLYPRLISRVFKE